MTFQVHLDDEAMKKAVEAAIFAQLTTEKRDELVQTAIKSLLTPVYDKYSHDNRSPLVQAFHFAASNVANRLVNDMLTNDEKFQQQVRTLFFDAWNKAMEDKGSRDKIVTSIASTIGDVLSGELQRRY